MFFVKLLRSFSLKFLFLGKSFVGLAALPLIFILFATIAHSAEVGLEWDPNIEPELAGYKLYYGLDSGNYTSSVDVGNQTSFTIPDLEYDTIYYFAVTAYDIYGEESDYSEEISYSVPSSDVDSDNDGISDTDEINIYGTDPYNADTDADGINDGDEINNYGTDPNNPDTDGDGIYDGEEIRSTIIEAESGALTSPMQIVSDSEASGGSYVETTQSESGTAIYTFNIDSPGVYKIIARVYAPDGGSDSFYVDIDDQGEFIWDLNPVNDPNEYNIWRDDEITNRGTGTFDNPQYDPYTVELNQGTHTIALRGRESSSKLDCFYFQKVGDIQVSTGPEVSEDIQISTDPVVSILSPGDGTYLSKDWITIQVEAFDDGNIEMIELYVDDVLKKVEYSNNLYCHWGTAAETAGQHTISAKAYDTDGNMGVGSVFVYK